MLLCWRLFFALFFFTMYKMTFREFKIDKELSSSLQWPWALMPFKMSYWFSLMKDLYFWEKRTIICMLSALISGLKSFLSFLLVSLLRQFSEQLCIMQSVLVLSFGTNSHTFVSSIKLILFLNLVVILFLIYNASSGYALIIGTMFSDKQLAVTLTPVLIIPFMLFAGFFVN